MGFPIDNRPGIGRDVAQQNLKNIEEGAEAAVRESATHGYIKTNDGDGGRPEIQVGKHSGMMGHRWNQVKDFVNLHRGQADQMRQKNLQTLEIIREAQELAGRKKHYVDPALRRSGLDLTGGSRVYGQKVLSAMRNIDAIESAKVQVASIQDYFNESNSARMLIKALDHSERQPGEGERQVSKLVKEALDKGGHKADRLFLSAVNDTLLTFDRFSDASILKDAIDNLRQRLDGDLSAVVGGKFKEKLGRDTATDRSLLEGIRDRFEEKLIPEIRDSISKIEKEGLELLTRPNIEAFHEVVPELGRKGLDGSQIRKLLSLVAPSYPMGDVDLDDQMLDRINNLADIEILKSEQSNSGRNPNLIDGVVFQLNRDAVHGYQRITEGFKEDILRNFETHSQAIEGLLRQFPGGTRPTLDYILGSREISSQFASFTVREFGIENYDFYREAERALAITNLRQLKENIQDLIDKFVRDGAPREINIDYQVRERFLRVFEREDATLSDLVGALQTVQKAIFDLMQSDSLPRFMNHIRGTP